MPTIGQLDFAVAASGLAFALGNFDCGNFLRLVFIREEDALDSLFALRPCALFTLVWAYAAYKLRL